MQDTIIKAIEYYGRKKGWSRDFITLIAPDLSYVILTMLEPEIEAAKEEGC